MGRTGRTGGRALTTRSCGRADERTGRKGRGRSGGRGGKGAHSGADGRTGPTRRGHEDGRKRHGHEDGKHLMHQGTRMETGQEKAKSGGHGARRVP